jgi:hypothetical protein
VQFRIDRKLTSSGTWTTVNTYTITGKSVNTYEVQYLVDRAGASGTWDIRVTRITADPGANVNNQTRFERLTEIQYVQLQYDDTAYVGVAIDAASVGNAIPHRSYLVKGTRVQIPSNYNPVTRVYSGSWNGTFTTAWTDNPAWCLYDMLTNTRYGMGEFVSASNVEKYSFYDAGVYSDELVNDGNGGTEPRFTFNVRIAAQDQFWRSAYLCAGAMHSSLVYLNNTYVLIQDRPSDPIKTISKDNVINGKFKRKSSSREERHTAVNVTWNNRADRHLQVVSTVEDTAGIARYGYYPTDIAAYGATTEGQAIRHGKYVLYTELNQVHQVAFEMTFDGFDLIQGDVIKILDEDWANIQQAGRITVAIGVAGTTVTFDRPITITAGSTISITMPDGSGIQTRAIVETSGVRSSVTIASAFTMAIPIESQFLVETSTVSAKQYKIMGVKQTDINIVEVQCVEHDPSKYALIETGISVPTPVFSNAIRTVVLPPTSLVFAEESVVLPNEYSQRKLRAIWTPPTGTVKGYMVVWWRNDGDRTTEFVSVPRVLVDGEKDGTYYFNVFSVDYNDNQSGTSVSGSYVLDSTLSAGSILGTFGAVQNLYVTGTSGTTWSQDNLLVNWIDNVGNNVPTTGYKVEVTTVGGTVLHSEVVTDKSYMYPITSNIAEGGPRPIVNVKVYPRDASNRYGPVNTTTFTNNPPAAITGLGTTGSFKGVWLTWDISPETDVAGYLVWRSTTLGFTPSSANLICDQTGTAYTDFGLSDAQTYYYKIAAYDIFSRNETGAGLNVVASAAVTTLDANNTNEYLLNGVTWTPNSPSANSVAWSAATVTKTVGTSSGSEWAITAGNAAWTSGVLYIYYTEGETILRSTSTVSTAIANNKIIVATYRGGTNLEVGNGKAYMDGSFIIAGTVAAAQLVTGTAVITQSAQIANAIVDNAQIANLAVTNGKIANLAVDAAKIANATITGAKIASATITNANIASATITNANIVNATIETLKLKNGAVNDTKVLLTGGSVTITLGSGFSQSGSLGNTSWVCVSPTSVPGPFKTIVTVSIPCVKSSSSYSAEITADVQLRRGDYAGTLLQTQSVAISFVGTKQTGIAIFALDTTPGLQYTINMGTVTAYIQAGSPAQTLTASNPVVTVQTILK